MTRSLSAAVLATLIAGCNWGLRPADFPPAVSPAGAQVAARVRGENQDRIGELLTADSNGVVIRSTRIIRVPWTQLDAMDVDRVGGEFDVRFGETADPEKRERLRLISRFPQGLSGDLLTRVLALERQDSLVIITAPPVANPSAVPPPHDATQHGSIRHDASVDSLVARTARSSARFADRHVAIEEGYRRIGVDFPSMGEHWINSSVLLSGAIDPARPTMLSYVTIDGRPRLIGVGFVVVTEGDSAPGGAPGWPAAWHEHSGLLSDESGAHAGGMHHATSTTHVWVLHAWTGLRNPAGVNAPDNWAIPFARAGVENVATIDPDAAQALALEFGGDEHLVAALTDAGLRTSATAAPVDSAIAEARRSVALIATRIMADHVVTDGQMHELHHTWMALSSTLHMALGDASIAFLAPPHMERHP